MRVNGAVITRNRIISSVERSAICNQRAAVKNVDSGRGRRVGQRRDSGIGRGTCRSCLSRLIHSRKARRAT